MPILKSLTFTAVPARSHDPVANRRAKLVERLEEQKKLLANPSFVRTVQRWTGKGEERRQLEKQQRVKPWWRADSAGHIVMAIYHGARPVEFEKGKAGIAVASRDKLPSLIDGLIAAAQGRRARRDCWRARLSPSGPPRPVARPDGSKARRGLPSVARGGLSSPAEASSHGQTTRPAQGTSGRAAVLARSQVRQVFRIARARGRLAARAEAVFALSIGLGLRAKELASLKWADVYEADGSVRAVVHLKAAYTKGARTRDVFLSSPALRRVLERYGEKRWLLSARASQAPLFPSQKGGHLTACSMARFLNYLYREAGVASATSHSGRRTLITRLAERGVDLKAIAQIAGHSTIRTTAMYVEANPVRLAKILQDVTF